LTRAPVTPPRSNREAVRKYRARKKQEEGRAAAELREARARADALASENARLRALLAQIGGLVGAAAALGGGAGGGGGATLALPPPAPLALPHSAAEALLPPRALK
jgi:hypothetical protein